MSFKLPTYQLKILNMILKRLNFQYQEMSTHCNLFPKTCGQKDFTFQPSTMKTDNP